MSHFLGLNNYEALLLSASEHPKAIAITYNKLNITYEELVRRIEIVAKALVGIGVKKGDVVAMATMSFPEAIYLFYAINRVGAIVNSFDVRSSPDQIVKIINESKAKILFAFTFMRFRIKKAMRNLSLNKLVYIDLFSSFHKDSIAKNKIFALKHKQVLRWEDFLNYSSLIDELKNVNHFPNDNDVVAMYHTSGTSGIPKTMLVPKLAYSGPLMAHLDGDNFVVKVGDSSLTSLPPFSLYGMISGHHLPLVFGCRLILSPLLMLKNVERVIIKEKPNHFIGVPSNLEWMSKKNNSYDVSFFKSITLAGDIITSEYEKTMNDYIKNHHGSIKITNCYGMSETSGIAKSSLDSPLGSVGKPLSFVDVEILDDKNNIVGPDIVGEISVLTPYRCNGYLNSPEANKELFKDGTLKRIYTGDFGYLDKDGYLFVIGRKKRMITRPGGTKVFLSHIENIVDCDNSVLYSLAIAKKEKAHAVGDKVVLYVVLKKHANHLATKLRLLQSINISKEHIISLKDIHIVRFLPRTELGKRKIR